MAKQLLLGIFLIFIALVAANYLFSSAFAGNIFFAPFAPFSAPGPIGGGAHALTDVNFSIFDKGGGGLSYVTQGYGRTSFSYEYIDGFHNGIDIAADYGAPVHSPADGIVLATGNQDAYCPGRGFGMYVALFDPANDVILWFAHLGRISVTHGASIVKGTVIGTIGATGLETGTHLHFSIFKAQGFSMPALHGCGPDPSGTTVNPLSYLGTVYQ